MKKKILKSEFYTFVERVTEVKDEVVVESLLKDNWYILVQYLKDNEIYYCLGYAPRLQENYSL